MEKVKNNHNAESIHDGVSVLVDRAKNQLQNELLIFNFANYNRKPKEPEYYALRDIQ